jgi:hypothetical protein
MSHVRTAPKRAGSAGWLTPAALLLLGMLPVPPDLLQ